MGMEILLKSCHCEEPAPLYGAKKRRGNLMGSEKQDCAACSEAVIEIASSYKTFLAMKAKGGFTHMKI